MSNPYSTYGNKGNRDPKKNGYLITRNIAKKYLKLRSAIGVLGILLPILLVFISLINKNGCGVLPSISDYYHTSVGGVFTGLLIAIAIFLIYDGEDKEEKLICRIAGILAIIIAFAPTPIDENYILTLGAEIDLSMFNSCYIPKIAANPLIGGIHFGAATLFFLLLSYLVGVKFRKSEKDALTKTRRNWYVVCGLGMIIPLILIAIFKLFYADIIGSSSVPIVFLAEFIMLLFFGISWLIRGEVMFNTSSKFFEE